MNEARILDVLENAIARGAVTGVAVAVTGPKETLLEMAAGRVGHAPSASPLQPDSVFWIASMTKALTSVAAMQLVEADKLSLDAPIGALLPDLARPEVLEGFRADGSAILRPAKQAITLKHLLTHTSGFSYEFCNADLARYLKQYKIPVSSTGLKAGLRHPLIAEPGASWAYGISTDWAGMAVEAASGLSLPAYFEKFITGPLGMPDTSFRPDPEQTGRLVKMQQRGADGALSDMHWEPRPTPEFCSGGGGLYSTVQDYQRFLRVFLNGGEAGGIRILKPETVTAMSVNQIGDLRAGTIDSADPSISVPADCYYWIDPARKIAAIYLTQVMPAGDLSASLTYVEFEKALYASL